MQRLFRFAAGILIGGCMISVSFGQSGSAPPPASPFPPDYPGASHAATDLRVPGPNPGGWLFPLTELDRRLPSWIQFGGQFRDRFEAVDGLKFAPVNDGYDLTQLRLGLYVQPLTWLKFLGVTQDSRIFFNDHVPSVPPNQNIWDIREAYAQIGSSTEGWFDVSGGREILSFGDERVIGPSDWLNQGRTFDTVKVDLHQPGVNISLFAASVSLARTGVVDHHLEGNNLYGAYTSITTLIAHATVEPYLFWRVAPAGVTLPENEGHGHLNEVTGGARIAGTFAGNFDYDVEMNKQTGSLGHYTIDAWAGHWNAGYTFKNARWTPRPFGEYNYASGNKNPHGDTWGTHDQIYPSAHDKLDFADQVGWRNSKDLRGGVSEQIAQKWQLTQVFDDLWLATKNDAVYFGTGPISIAPHPNATSTHLGTELEMMAGYKENNHLTYGFGFARLFTGTYLNEVTRGKDYNYPFASVTYLF